ncbi:MAG: prepilin peptidase, partial [Myxococcota bacterium]
WCWLRGRCRDCGQPISPLYPLLEALTAVLAALLARHLFVSWSDLDAAHLVAWVYQMGFVSLLVVLATVDIKHRIIPDETSIYAVPFGIAGHGVLAWLGYDGWWTIPPFLPLALPAWLIPPALAALAAGCFYALFWVSGAMTSWFMRKDALGFGDVKLAAMLGSFLGPQLGVAALLASSLLSLVVGLPARVLLWREVWTPYGPAAAVAALGVVYFGDVPVLEMIVRRLYGA